MIDQATFKQDLRSVLIPEKNGIEINRLNKEYRDLIGTNIPYNRNIYPTLESFLITLTDVCRIVRHANQTMVVPIVSEKQKQLKALINGQKTTRKVPTRRPMFSRSSFADTKSSVYVRRTSTGFTRYSNNQNYQSSRYPSSNNSGTRYFNGSSKYSNDKKPSTTYYNNNNNYSNNNIKNSGDTRESQVNGKYFDIRAQNGAVKVMESKPSDYSKNESKSSDYSKNESKSSDYSKNESKSPDYSKNESIKTDLTNNDSNRNSTFRNSPKSHHQNSRSGKKPFITNKLNFDILDGEPEDYKYQLAIYAKENNLEDPKYVVSNYCERGRVIAYFSKVQIGLRSWLIFPDAAYRTADGADCGVAKKALQELKAEKRLKVTDSTDGIADKIMKFFSDSDPLWSTAVEDLFVSQYGEKLNENWLDLIRKSGRFDVDEHSVGKQKLILISPSKKQPDLSFISQSEKDTKNDQKNEAKNDQQNDANISSNSDQGIKTLIDKIKVTNLQECESQELPESLELSKTDWHVMILRATNTREIVMRLTSNTQQLDQLISNLQKFYNDDKLGEQAKNIVINKVYAAVFDGAVFRVHTILLEDRDVYCWFLDDGIYEKISKSNLYEIKNQFMKFPFQAFCVQLQDLQDQSESLIRKYIDDKLKENDDAFCLVARPIDLDPIIVRLYDTSNDDKDVDVNKEIINFISKNPSLPGKSIPKPISPKFNEEDGDYETMKIKASMIVSPHNFIITDVKHLSANSPYLEMNNQMQDFYSNSDEHVELNSTMIYCGLFVCVHHDSKWHRARIDDLNGSRCTYYLVDQGRIVLADLRNIQPLYTQFLEFPMIAIKASLSSIIVPIESVWNIDTIIKFKDLIGEKEFDITIQEIVMMDGDSVIQLSEMIDNNNQKNIIDLFVETNKAKYL